MTVGQKGITTTVGIPGSGLSWSKYSRHGGQSGGEERQMSPLDQSLYVNVLFRVGNKTDGPLTLFKVLYRIVYGHLPPDTYVSEFGSDKWDMVSPILVAEARIYFEGVDRAEARKKRAFWLSLIIAIGGGIYIGHVNRDGRVTQVFQSLLAYAKALAEVPAADERRRESTPTPASPSASAAPVPTPKPTPDPLQAIREKYGTRP